MKVLSKKVIKIVNNCAGNLINLSKVRGSIKVIS